MIECEKTGFHAFISARDEYIYGDAFRLNFDTLLFRVCQVSRTPIAGVKHYTLHTWSLWFDEGKTSPGQNSTLICNSHDVDCHGYDGVPV